MILVLNAIVKPEARDRFDRVTAPRLAALAGQPVQIVHLATNEPFPSPEGRTHLVISGSELRASQPHERDAEVYALIRSFVDAEKPVLGICWGHQMLAKALAGDGVCRPAAQPELGWRCIDLVPNMLFEGIEHLVSAQSHYDEVFDLPEPMRVIASTPDCAVQAFQLDGLPVWGIQFHAEIAHDHGRAMFERNLREDPCLQPYFHDELDDPETLDANTLLFENFFAADRVDVGA